MRKFKFSKVLALSSVLLLGSFASSCSFFGSDEYTISSFVHEDIKDENNNVIGQKITIEFGANSTLPTYTFTLSDGAGIKNIEVGNFNEATNEVELIITYNDDHQTKKTILMPLIKGEDGKNGKGIKSLTEGQDEEGNPIIIIEFDDETPSISFPLQKGEDGDGVVAIDYETLPNGVTVVTFYRDINKEHPLGTIQIPAAKSIDYVEVIYDDTSNSYQMVIYYNNGESSEPMDIGSVTKWFTGTYDPNSETIADFGNIGDFYFNTNKFIIYQKVSVAGTKWKVVANLGSTPAVNKTYTVSFNLSEPSDATASFNYGEESSYEIKAGYNFYSEGYELPLPTCTNGYSFAGWYTSRKYNVNLGSFTDLTVVNSDTNLWARWVK